MRIAVVGASGYSGLELVRLLVRHPEAEMVALTSEQRAGEAVGDAYPALRGLVDLRFESADPDRLAARVDFVLATLPHHVSAPIVARLRKQGLPVVDLSADYRLRDQARYEAAYGPHQAPEIFGQAVYGLPELHREAIRESDFVAAAGCYPTSVLVPLVPFLRADAVDPTPIHVDSKSGVSGAGRKVDAAFLFAEVDENCRAYNVGGGHRHVPEIEEQASAAAGAEVRVAFTPHLLPTIRGINTSVYARPRRPLSTAQARAILEESYADEGFVRVLPEGALPSLAAVRGTNFCDVQALVDERTGSLLLLSALDNLCKGAAGQMVQCMNLMRGWPEDTALREAALQP